MADKYIARDPQEGLHLMKMEEVLYQNLLGANLQILERVVFISTFQAPQVTYGPLQFRNVRTDGDRKYIVFGDGTAKPTP